MHVDLCGPHNKAQQKFIAKGYIKVVCNYSIGTAAYEQNTHLKCEHGLLQIYFITLVGYVYYVRTCM